MPKDIIAKCATLRAMPRKVREIMYDPDQMSIVDSDAFFGEIPDASAAIAFPHFGFGGWKAHYTGYCPIWKLPYMIPVWAKVFNLKQMAQTMNYLSEHSATDFDALKQKAADAAARYDMPSEQIKAKEQRLSEITTLRTHIAQYFKTRAVYVEYRKNGYSKSSTPSMKRTSCCIRRRRRP